MKPWIIMGNGRISRLQGVAYDFGVLLLVLPLIAIGLWLALKGYIVQSIVVDIVTSLITIPVQLMFSIRRLHDMNAHGAWSVIQIPMSVLSPKALFDPDLTGLLHTALVVMYIIFFVYALLLLFVPGTAGDNRYGPPPPPNSSWVMWGAVTAILLPVAGCTAGIVFGVMQAAAH